MTKVRNTSRDLILTVINRALAVDGPQLTQDPSQRLSHSSDPSIPLFSLYLRLSKSHDWRKYELLKGEIDSILIFVSHSIVLVSTMPLYHFTRKLQCGLFSATVAGLVSIAVPSNITNLHNSSTLWLYSLILAIYSALRALRLQRWVKRRTFDTSHYSLLEQAKMGASFARRIERSNEAVRKLHRSIVSSLLVFLWALIVYLIKDDPYTMIISLPLILSYPFSYLYFKIKKSYLYFKIKKSYLFLKIKKVFRRGSSHYAPITREKIQEQGSWFDGYILKRTLDMSGSDDDLEQFFEAIPGFCASKFVDNPRRGLELLGLPRLAEALIEFWNRTLSSNRVSESVKVRRLVVCVRVIEAAELSITIPHILHLLSGKLSEVSRSIEKGHSLRPLYNGNSASLVRGIIASVISSTERNDRWFSLVMDELGISGDVLRGYLAHGDSVLLANMNHITHHFFHALLQPHPDHTRKSSSILSSLSKFDILNTLPELQHNFCDLWSEVVQQARRSGADDNPFIDILVQIWHLYDVLHGSDIPLGYFGYFLTSTTGHDDLFHQPPSYPFLIPLCMMPDHHPESTTHSHEASSSTIGGASQTITTGSPTRVLSKSSPGDVLDVSHHTATSMDISLKCHPNGRTHHTISV